jgi:two-component system cell cycle response regulator
MRVLIAEDDPTSRLLLEKLLARWGHEVVATRDGREALNVLLSAGAPRLAILDWMMPEMDGVDVVRSIRELETRQPPYIILLTALDETKSVVAGLEAGADDYVGKPYNADELRARVEVGRRLVELTDELLEARHAFEVLARTDALTGVFNRRAILDELERETARSLREGSSLGVGMLDVDRFKRVNDSYGHAAGDEVLREVVARAVAVLRPYDAFGRIGGEEFLVIVHNPAPGELAGVLERIRASVAGTPFAVGDLRFTVTVSLGGVVRVGESGDRLLALADDALYAAKEQGRDRVVLAGRPRGPSV